MKKYLWILILTLVVLIGLSVVQTQKVLAYDCVGQPQNCTDGKFDKEKWCMNREDKEAGVDGGAGSVCCGAGDKNCKSPCWTSYCEEDECIKFESCDAFENGITHAHGCDWVKLDANGNLVYSHGIPTMNISSRAMYLLWRLAGCPHTHPAYGTTDADKCFNIMQTFPQAHGSHPCITDADCTTTTTTKGSTNCNTGETNPHYTCDNVNTYDSSSKSYTNVYCVKKNWCGVTNCNTKDNKTTIKDMFIEGVWIKDANYYHNDKCTPCPAGQTYPHTECETKSIYYQKGAYKYKYIYETCKEINSCGVDECDFSKNTYEQIGNMWVVESAECKAKTDTTTTTTTTTTTAPSDPDNKIYICDPNSENISGYGQCILVNKNQYTTFRRCSNKNDKVKITETECKPNNASGSTCIKIESYNTDCVIPTTTSSTKPVNYCHISFLHFKDNKDNEYDTYSIFSKPENGILSNPKLEYTANYCSECKLEITPSIDLFINENSDVFGNLIGNLIEGYANRYVFMKSPFNDKSISLNIKSLKPDKYTITLTCTDPETDNIQTKSIKLSIFPTLRWREVVPVIQTR